ncbi:MAG: hypothetical protein LBQ43_04735 [Holosporales bacterium]|nr:hypothetical protein [Holosporales bacterium]
MRLLNLGKFLGKGSLLGVFLCERACSAVGFFRLMLAANKQVDRRVGRHTLPSTSCSRSNPMKELIRQSLSLL